MINECEATPVTQPGKCHKQGPGLRKAKLWLAVWINVCAICFGNQFSASVLTSFPVTFSTREINVKKFLQILGIAITASLFSTNAYPLIYLNAYFQELADQETFRNADNVFVCSSFSNFNRHSVLEFYARQYPENTKVKIFDGVVTNEISPADYSIILVFGAKPLEAKFIQCLKAFPDLPDEWISKINTEAEVVGTIPEFFKDIPGGEYFAPVQATYVRLRAQSFSLHGIIMAERWAESTCAVLFDLFDQSDRAFRECQKQKFGTKQ